MKKTFEIHQITAALFALQKLNKEWIHEDMFLIDEEITLLSQSRGFAVPSTCDDQITGDAYAVPSRVVSNLLLQHDCGYRALPRRMYIYSVAVHPNFRKKYIGTELRKQLCIEGQSSGYDSGNTHTSIIHSWDKSGRRLFRPNKTHVVKIFRKVCLTPHVEYREFY